MAAGLPVVAADAGGPREIIEDGVDGLLFEPGSAPALATQLRRLSEDRALRERLGRAARTTAEVFDAEAISREVVWTYRRVISKRGARTSRR
jgi:glycosyltransferase involved in cell wall biosynthesis